MPILDKPVADLTYADIAGLIGEAEGQYLEFKQVPPNANVGSQGLRSKIAAEIVAFANADGGHLVLGAVETDESPRRLEALQEISNVYEEADNLLRSLV